jgi:glycopeptide antibiotics resistance protein
MKPGARIEVLSTYSRRLLGISALAILLLTLFPYHFQKTDTPGPFLDFGIASFNLDFFLNILLFIPFGLCLVAWRKLKRQKSSPGLATALLGSVLLSGLVEFLQQFLPHRDPSLSDILSNSLGGVIGFAFYAFSPDKFARLMAFLEKPKITKRTPRPGLIFLLYLAAGVLASVELQRRINLESWNDSYPLLLGNERTGSRPWSGQLISFEVADRAVTEKQGLLLSKDPAENLQSPVTALRFLKKGTGTKDFSWKGGAPPMLDSPEDGALDLPGVPWLESSQTGMRITRRLKKANQFTLRLQCAPAGIMQSGPARIISISTDPHRRNITIGQDNRSLVVRLRTPATGENGMAPALVAPSVFESGRIGTIVVAYDGSVLRVFANGEVLNSSLDLGPASLLFGAMASSKDSDLKGYKVLYYGIVFMPLGFLLAEIRGRNFISPLLLIAGALFASVVLEVALCAASGKFFSWMNIFWGVLMTLIPLLLMYREDVAKKSL